MNRALVVTLIKKDWYLSRVPLTMIAIAGAISTGLLYLRSETGGIVSMISTIIALVFLSILLPQLTVLNERREKTLAFAMSLPISSMEYTAAKVVGNLSAFLLLWLAISGAFIGTIALGPYDGIIPLAVISAFAPFMAFSLMLAVAIVAESELLAMVTMGVCNVAYSFAWLAIIRFDLIKDVRSPVPVWNERILAVLGTEITVILVAIALTFYLQSRKTNFV
jgi:hypothetical protein